MRTARGNVGCMDYREDGILRPAAATDGGDSLRPEEAAPCIPRGVEKGHDFIPPVRVAWLASFLMRVAPGLCKRVRRRRMTGT